MRKKGTSSVFFDNNERQAKNWCSTKNRFVGPLRVRLDQIFSPTFDCKDFTIMYCDDDSYPGLINCLACKGNTFRSLSDVTKR